ncbi:MAG: 16S rRNA (cytosine(1402)-N(4))-methyltransferase RsmH [Bdellovibrionota bacterium]
MTPERESQHLTVLLREAVAPMVANHGNIYIDCTLGGGGHTEALLKKKPQARVVAIDRDQDMLDKAATRFRDEIAAGRLTLVHGNYGDIRERLNEIKITKVDGILVDAGVSSFQIDIPERGFSFMKSGPLDMRMDRTQPLTAFEVVNQWPRQELEKVFFEYGEERFSRKIASRIVEAREKGPIADTLALSRIIEDCLPRAHGPRKGVHPATRIFQAIRIAVNGELDGLRHLLAEIPEILNPGGVFSAISFHSLEDRLVKERLRYLTNACVCPLMVVTCPRCNHPPGFLLQKKPFLPSEEEMDANPRARSAKLRVFVRNSEEIRKPPFEKPDGRE